MQEETKQCQNCKNAFTIDATDFAFYDKIKVPPPTWCPECRMRRRFTFYNLNRIFKRRENLTGGKILSTFSDFFRGKVYEVSYWWSDNWDPMEYGREYDFTKPFFAQLESLMLEVPLPSRSIVNLIDSDYSANATGLKNCYMLFNAQRDENCLYSISIMDSKECADSHLLFSSELCYDCFMVGDSYKTLYSSNCFNCQEVYFSKDLRNCNRCFGCVGLRNKKFCIFNEQFSQEGYEEKIREFNLGSFSGVENIRKKIEELAPRIPRRFMNGTKNENVSGDYINSSKNVKHSFIIADSENIKYSYNLASGGSKDSYDHNSFGNNTELVYESSQVGNNSARIKFCFLCFNNNSDLEYCTNCMSASNLFACVGLRNKQHCILNKQYTKEEYNELVPKIKKHMDEMPYIDRKGRVYKYGEFFPIEFSPYAYNKTVAQEYYPLDSVTAEKEGYAWSDEEKRDYEITKRVSDLPDDIHDVDESILTEVIECEHRGTCREQCTKAFKIVPRELQFYKQMNIPLPRICFNCRHARRLLQRNNPKLYLRQCQCAGEKSHNQIYTNTATHAHGTTPCPTEFETSYAPDRQEIVYCESCYQQEVV